MLWIVVGIVVLAIAAWAFWPRAGGLNDGDVRRKIAIRQGRATAEGRSTDGNSMGGGFGSSF